MNKKIRNYLGLILVGTMAFPLFLQAAPKTKSGVNSGGILTRVEGDVFLLIDKAKAKQAKKKEAGTEAIFEEKAYLEYHAKIGETIEEGTVIRTTPKSRARITYTNGDALTIGHGTIVSVGTVSEEGKKTTELDLRLGRVRGLIEKGGARGNLKVRARSATMGVRGTDFYVTDTGNDEGAQFVVVSGKVEVLPINTLEKMNKSYEVKTGDALTIEDRKVDLKPATKQELATIIAVSKIDPTPSSDLSTEKKIKELEKKSIEVAKAHGMLSNAGAGSVFSLDDLSVKSVEKLIARAPEGKGFKKPSKRDLETVDQDVYEKYYEQK